MDKIKPDAPSLLEKIRKLAFPDLLSEISLRLAIAKNLFIIACVLYYFLYLAIIGGLLGADMADFLSLAYGALAFATFFLLYTLVDYGLVIYFEKIRKVRFVAGAIIMLLFLTVASVKLGFVPHLVS